MKKKTTKKTRTTPEKTNDVRPATPTSGNTPVFNNRYRTIIEGLVGVSGVFLGRAFVVGELDGTTPRFFDIADRAQEIGAYCRGCREGLDLSEDSPEGSTIVGTVRRPFLECGNCGRRMRIDKLEEAAAE